MDSAYIVSTAGIEAQGRACVLDQYENILYLEIAGNPTSVKSVFANLLGNSSAQIENKWYSRNPQRHYLMKTIPFPSGKRPKASDGWLHGFLMQRMFQGDVESVQGKKYELDWYPSDEVTRFNFLIPKNHSRAEIEIEFFQRLTWFGRGINGVKTPLHFEWRHWLWNEFITREWLMHGTTLYGDWLAFQVTFNESLLQEMVETALKARTSGLFSVFFTDQEEEQAYRKGELELVTAREPTIEELADEDEAESSFDQSSSEEVREHEMGLDDVEYTLFQGLRLDPYMAKLLADNPFKYKWLFSIIAISQRIDSVCRARVQRWELRTEVYSEPADGSVVAVSVPLGAMVIATNEDGDYLFEEESPLLSLYSFNLAVNPKGLIIEDPTLDEEMTLQVDGNILSLVEGE